MSVLTLEWTSLRPVLFYTILFPRDGYKFENALAVTGLEDVPDGQSVRGRLTANNVQNKVADYFLTEAGADRWQK